MQSGRSGSKPVAEILVAVQRQRAIGQAVEGMRAMHDAGAPRRAARELDRGLDRLRAGIGEEHLVQIRDVARADAPRARRRASRRRVARDWAGRRRARCPAPRAATDGCGRSRKRRSRSVDRDSGHPRDRRDIGLAPSEADVIADGLRTRTSCSFRWRACMELRCACRCTNISETSRLELSIRCILRLMAFFVN